MKQYLEAGKIVTTHGVAGEIKVYPWADSAEALCGVKQFFLDAEGKLPRKVLSARAHKNMLLLKLEGIATIEEARKYIERTLWVDRKAIKLEKGAHFVVDLIGLRVLHAEDGSEIGVLSDVTTGGKQDIYHVTLSSGEVRMVPVVPAFVKDIRPDKGYVTILPIKGLLSDED